MISNRIKNEREKCTHPFAHKTSFGLLYCDKCGKNLPKVQPTRITNGVKQPA